MQVMAYSCFAEAVKNKIGIEEFKKSFPRSLDLRSRVEKAHDFSHGMNQSLN